MRKFEVLVRVVFGDFRESLQFLRFLDECLDDPDARKGLLGEVIKPVELLLPFFPFVGPDQRIRAAIGISVMKVSTISSRTIL